MASGDRSRGALAHLPLMVRAVGVVLIGIAVAW